MALNKDIVKGKWMEMKGKVKQQWGKLTDDDVTQMKGSYEELEGALRKRYGYERDQAEREIQMWFDKNNWH